MSVMPCSLSSRTICSMMGILSAGVSGLGRCEVRGRRRVPSPPAMMTAFMQTPPLRQRPWMERRRLDDNEIAAYNRTTICENRCDRIRDGSLQTEFLQRGAQRGLVEPDSVPDDLAVTVQQVVGRIGLHTVLFEDRV